MNLSKKIKFFSFGLLLGTFFLVTILNGKNLSCNYGPESRVINNLKQKKWTFDNEKKALDTFNLVDFLENSKVVFNKSNTKNLLRNNQIQYQLYLFHWGFKILFNSHGILQ